VLVSDWVMAIVPLVVIVPPVIGPVVAIEVTVPLPPPPPVVRVAVRPDTVRVPSVTSRVVMGRPVTEPPSATSDTVRGGMMGPLIQAAPSLIHSEDGNFEGTRSASRVEP